ncbi:hypothetical protein [Brevundimonas sp. AAP58]|uniref:hypothetical protein n=1 Tax=Brevundimonas sp. AAP58 TaxID=1523422 RepID=UPI0012E1F957|nr:hypothetical protein [Brevundimonas sp. AAP58]
MLFDKIDDRPAPNPSERTVGTLGNALKGSIFSFFEIYRDAVLGRHFRPPQVSVHHSAAL